MTCRRSSLRKLAAIRREVATLSRMVAADRPCPDLLPRISAVRAELRAMERGLVLDHVARSFEDRLPGEENARIRQELLALFSSYPRGTVPSTPSGPRPESPEDRRETS